jgi:transposase
MSDDSFNEENSDSFDTAPEDVQEAPEAQLVVRRGQYDKVTDEKYELIIESLERGEAPADISRWLKVKRRTVYSIRQRYESTGNRQRIPRGGRRWSRLGEALVLELVAMVEENPLLTLVEMRRKLTERHSALEVSTTTISRALENQLITLKCLTKDADVPEARNRPENIAHRRDFAQWLVGLPPACQLIYLDETGYNIWTRRSQGRSRRGQRVRRVVHTQRGVQVNIVQAISPTLGLVHHQTLAVTMNAARFQQFIEEMMHAVTVREDVQPGDQFCVVMDGASFHRGAHIPEQFRRQWQLKVLPPYSPFLNPVEDAHSCLKAAVKRQLGDPEVQREMDMQPPFATLSALCCNALLRLPLLR